MENFFSTTTSITKGSKMAIAIITKKRHRKKVSYQLDNKIQRNSFTHTHTLSHFFLCYKAKMLERERESEVRGKYWWLLRV